MERARILVIEDNSEVASLLQRGLSEEGFEVKTAATGELALRKATEEWDLVILDLMLPDVSGEGILSFLTQRLDHPPVLILTARGQIHDKVALFDLGCDDYMTKPFAFEELVGRVKALLRRAPRALPDTCECEDMRLDVSTHHLVIGRGSADEQQRVALTPKEFAICRSLMRRPGEIVSRKELLQAVWGLLHEPKTNFIEVHLANLRKKLGHVQRDHWLQTVRTSGFLLARPQGVPTELGAEATQV